MDKKQKMEFEEIYEAYYTKLYRYIYSHIGHKEDAEDMTNMVFVSCYENFEKFDSDKASIATWLYVIAGNRLKNYYRDKKQQISMDDDEAVDFFEMFGTQKDEIEQAVLLEEMSDMLKKAMNCLPQKQQKILQMRFYEGKSAEQMAKLLHMTPGNVRVMQNRALVKMREVLSHMDYL